MGLSRLLFAVIVNATQGQGYLLEVRVCIQGYLAKKKQPPPLGPPQDPGYSPTEGSQGGGISYERGTPIRGGRADIHARPKAAISFFRMSPRLMFQGSEFRVQDSGSMV
jgi:hypothetical protein